MSECLPVFPLKTVLFPGGVLPLKIFEARYIDMVSQCLRNQSGFVVANIKSGKETGKAAEFHRTGTEMKITDWEQRKDGLLGITAHGVQKVNISHCQVRADQLVVCEMRPVEPEQAHLLPEEFADLRLLLQKILGQIGPPFNTLAYRLEDSAWVAGRLTEFLPLPREKKQALLELDEPLSRLFMLRDLMLNLEIL